MVISSKFLLRSKRPKNCTSVTVARIYYLLISWTEKKAFKAIKMYFLERLKIAIFLKGLTHGFCQKLQISSKFDFD